MNRETRNSSLVPVGLPLFVGLVIATLVFSLAQILLSMSSSTAPAVAIGVAAAILALSTAAALASEDDAFYVKLLGAIIAIAIIVIGLVAAMGGERPEQGMLIAAGVAGAAIVGLTLLPRPAPTEDQLAEREKLPLRPILGNVALVALMAGVVGYGLYKESTTETPAATATATVVGTATPGTGGPTDGRVVTITTGDNFFDPAEITGAPGESITIEVTNNGVAIHNLAIAGGPKTDLIMAGGKGTVGFKLPDSGEVQFACEFHPPDMVGVIKVQ